MIKKRIIVTLILITMIFSMVGCNALDYKKAKRLYEECSYAEALELFTELDDYEDSQKLAKDCKYQLAINSYQNSDFLNAYFAFARLDDYEDSTTYKTLCIRGLLAGEWQDTNTAEKESGTKTSFVCRFEDDTVEYELYVFGKCIISDSGVYDFEGNEIVIKDSEKVVNFDLEYEITDIGISLKALTPVIDYPIEMEKR